MSEKFIPNNTKDFGEDNVIKTKAPMWAPDLATLIVYLKDIGNGTEASADRQIAPELCQIPAHVAKQLAAELESY